MMQDAAPIPFADARPAPVAYPRPARWPNAGRRRIGVTPEQSEKRKEWIVQIEAIRDRQDRAAFAELFAHFAPRVKAFLIRSGSNPDVAEECVQDVMAAVWTKAAMFDGSKASVATWIFTIARNRRIDLVRRARRPEPEELPWGPEAEPQPADVVAFQQEAERLNRALAELPATQRQMVERAFFGELSHRDIAEETGLPLGTIKSRIRLAIDRLRAAMKDED